MPEDNLYDRYMTARTAHRDHRATCTRCSDSSRCNDGQQVFETFTRLQDAYLNRQQQRR